LQANGRGNLFHASVVDCDGTIERAHKQQEGRRRYDCQQGFAGLAGAVTAADKSRGDKERHHSIGKKLVNELGLGSQRQAHKGNRQSCVMRPGHDG